MTVSVGDSRVFSVASLPRNDGESEGTAVSGGEAAADHSCHIKRHVISSLALSASERTARNLKILIIHIIKLSLSFGS